MSLDFKMPEFTRLSTILMGQLVLRNVSASQPWGGDNGVMLKGKKTMKKEVRGTKSKIRLSIFLGQP